MTQVEWSRVSVQRRVGILEVFVLLWSWSVNACWFQDHFSLHVERDCWRMKLIQREASWEIEITWLMTTLFNEKSFKKIPRLLEHGGEWIVPLGSWHTSLWVCKRCFSFKKLLFFILHLFSHSPSITGTYLGCVSIVFKVCTYQRTYIGIVLCICVFNTNTWYYIIDFIKFLPFFFFFCLFSTQYCVLSSNCLTVWNSLTWLG